jgi:diguanylate cyclase (GGDEF)-like protein
MDELELLRRRLLREKSARLQAEKIAEEKSRELYLKSQELERALEEEGRLKLELEKLSLTDPLTGLNNRRGFDLAARQQIMVAIRHHRPLSLLMLDIDFFKRVNDTYGHAAGDRVLERLSAIIFKNIRSLDIPARLGGEEFCILLPETNGDEALLLAERLRLVVAEEKFNSGDLTFSITISIGLVECSCGDDALERLLERGDLALYKAKQSGRNRSVVWSKEIV